MGELRGRSRKSVRSGALTGSRGRSGMAMRALRGARDLYGPRQFRCGGEPPGRRWPADVGGDRASEQELLELVHAMQARRGAAASAGAVVRSEKAEAGAPAAKRGGMTLERINEDTAVDHPTS
ncbi:hypothetical protein EJB05_52994, partial [Eragrostis curvula]